MPDKDASTPRVFILRHGETEWSKSGQYTGKTDIPLTSHGEAQVTATGRMAYGPGKLIDPAKVAKVYLSPRRRAIKTYELLSGRTEGYEIEEGLAEWDYGEYEGIKTDQIRAKRKAKGLDTEKPWDIWRDGCEGGESPAQVTSRIDAIISTIRAFHAEHMTSSEPKDVIIVAHGHLTRAFAKRWLGYPLEFPLSLMMEPGGVGILSYQHHSIDEPAMLLGIGFPVAE
ncbi:phosphoglycerate mutase family protein [Zymoseptoria brevis]|uniref:Phosphoglycerate mutase family protein n=1 Tax=Zymoseptoria brevis TaxID=1047168 RepID=A0A0F4GWH1_9PEZI|nr:phosphoglycerate mutase family protein [Zymoseptoria brevis]